MGWGLRPRRMDLVHGPMRKEDFTIEADGRSVYARLHAVDLEAACNTYRYADDNQPRGYVLRSCKISRRKKGGKLRFVELHYVNTFSPEPDWAVWVGILQPERMVAKGLDPPDLSTHTRPASRSHSSEGPSPIGNPRG